MTILVYERVAKFSFKYVKESLKLEFNRHKIGILVFKRVAKIGILLYERVAKIGRLSF